MRSVHSILMTTDLRSTGDEVTRVTARLAQAFGSRVTLLHVAGESDLPQVDYYRREIGRELLEPVAAALARERVNVVRTDVVAGSVVDRILRTADETDADLIVMGLRGDEQIGRLGPGPTSEAVMQHARRPVLGVRAGDPPLEFRRILCPIDGSETSLRGLRNAIRLAQVFPARLTVLSVVPDVSWLTAASETGTLVDVQEEYATSWLADRDRLLNTADFGSVVWNRDARRGSAAGEIVAAASEGGFDLIVMGATGRSGIARLLMGSTSRRVIQNPPCSLLVVHSEDLLLEELTEDDARTHDLLCAEADRLLASGSVEGALRTYDRVLALNPFHVAALEGRARTSESLGQYERAARCRRRIEVLKRGLNSPGVRLAATAPGEA